MGIQKKAEVSYNKMNRTALILFALFGLTMAMNKAHHKAKMIGLSRSECPSSWIGDGMCDGQCNTEESSWDGGDCCGPAAFMWFFGQKIVNVWTPIMKIPAKLLLPSGWAGDGICDDICNNEAN